jgi:hypothetical protein
MNHKSSNTLIILDPLSRCLDDRLTPFYLANYEFDANIRNRPLRDEEKDILVPYVGNGIFGLEIQGDSNLNIKGEWLVLL